MDHPPPSPASPGAIALQLTYVLALVLANGFFVAAEFALVSVRQTRIEQLAAEGNTSAELVKRALHEMDRHIAAAQVGITVVSLLLGSYGEKVLEPLLYRFAAFVGMPPVLFGITRVTVAFILAYLVMTALHVIIGEQLPKTAAIQKADSAALLIVRPMTWFTLLCTPLVWILTISVNFLLKLTGLEAGAGHAQVHSPEELDLLFRQSHEGGELNKTEFEILHRVVRFSDTSAREVMVPRVEMDALPIEVSRRALLDYMHGQPHTRVPVYHGSLDDVVGIAHLKDLVRFEAASLNGSAADGSVDGRDGAVDVEEVVNLMEKGLVRETVRVPETITIDRLLIEFKKHRQQMAIVIDEYGGTAGLVTMGDLLEQVFGDVHDEFDQPEPEIFTRADGRVQILGRVLIDEVNERFGLGFRSDEVDTMGGLVFNALARRAIVGDEVNINGALLRVESVDRLRITALSMQLPAGAATDDEDRTPS
ncbi:MAG: hemolysin family protein [Armatimonadota bacterium]|nr:hemolysin family protein [Armatimonadota bacterium]